MQLTLNNKSFEINTFKVIFNCSVCLLTIRDATTTPCGHTFCRNCLPERHGSMSEAVLVQARKSYHIFNCSVCLLTIRDATTTPCGHTFCRNCLPMDDPNADVVRAHPCPLCRQEFMTT
ncbi:uncharacterized protein [Amphiura filiformis]|uniref:uncharacterized protein n=1 Tax=Amphiura filiformis TaxID=82378 RepID=UPI003B20DD6A